MKKPKNYRLDNELIDKAKKATGIKSETELIEEGLKKLIETKSPYLNQLIKIDDLVWQEMQKLEIARDYDKDGNEVTENMLSEDENELYEIYFSMFNLIRTSKIFYLNHPNIGENEQDI